MLKSGAAVTLIKIPKSKSLKFFSNNRDMVLDISQPFAEERIAFLKSFSKNILSNNNAKKFPGSCDFWLLV
jgi:hypothetical protein